MPKLSVWLVRASLIYMGVGFLFGALILYHKGIPLYGWTWTLLNPHIEMMIYGWTMQFVMGMTYWILPRFSGANRFGRTQLGWWSFALLNAGVLLVTLDLWWSARWLPTVARLLMVVGVGAFVIMLWPRVKPLSENMPVDAKKLGQ